MKIIHTSSLHRLRFRRRPDPKLLQCILLALLPLQLVGSAAQTEEPEAGSTTNAPAVVPTKEADRAWSFSLSSYVYIVPESREYVQPTFTADRGWLHLEARYNYEDLETGSTWVGYNFSDGEELAWELTPMLGGVFGETTGLAPGYKGSLSWWKLELYSEGEYVWDVGDPSGSFFYNWSELSLWPVDWFRIGMVTQRTRAYDSDREVQRGILAGFAYKSVDFTTYVFNPDESKPILTLAVNVSF